MRRRERRRETLALLVLSLVAGASAARAQPAVPPPMEDIGVDERVGTRVPLDLPFTDADNAPVRLADYFEEGKPVLLIMAYSRCPMLCSLVLGGVAEVLGRVKSEPGRDYRVVTVSIDPSETPYEADRKQTILLEQVGYPGEGRRWPFLVGEEQAIRSLAESLGFRYTWDPRTRQYAHPAVVFVLAPDGMVSRYLYGPRFEPAVLAAALRDARQGQTGASDRAGGILSCFRFESVLQKYGSRIETMFRLGALLVFAVLLFSVAHLFRRERRRQGRREQHIEQRREQHIEQHIEQHTEQPRERQREGRRS